VYTPKGIIFFYDVAWLEAGLLQASEGSHPTTLVHELVVRRDSRCWTICRDLGRRRSKRKRKEPRKREEAQRQLLGVEAASSAGLFWAF
jgi:hypothetical protein